MSTKINIMMKMYVLLLKHKVTMHFSGLILLYKLNMKDSQANVFLLVDCEMKYFLENIPLYKLDYLIVC